MARDFTDRNRWVRCNLLALLVIATYVGFPDNVSGQPWIERLKKENPDQLYVAYSQFGKCPFEEPSIRTMIEGLLVRSRLKQTSYAEWVSQEPNLFQLDIGVHCDDDEEAPYLFLVDTKFEEYVTVQRPAGSMQVFMSHFPGYARWGTFNPRTKQSDNHLRNTIRESVEDALTEYLKANFDL